MEEVQFPDDHPQDHIAKGIDQGYGHVLEEIDPGCHGVVDAKIFGIRGNDEPLVGQPVIIIVYLPSQGAVANKDDSREEHVEQDRQGDESFYRPVPDQQQKDPAKGIGHQYVSVP